MTKKIKNIIAAESILEDKLRLKQMLEDLIRDFKRSGEDADELEATLVHLDNDIAKLRYSMRNNPAEGEHRWAYIGIPMNELDNVVKNGIKTSFDVNVGRGVLYTHNPNVANALKGPQGQLVRFPEPADGHQLVALRGAYKYSQFTSKAIPRRDIEVYLSGNFGDDASWVAVGALR